MTLQEVFDKVARHLLTQGQRSILRETGRCAYRGDEGCMCAVGVLIADEHYHPKLEDNSVGSGMFNRRFAAVGSRRTRRPS